MSEDQFSSNKSYPLIRELVPHQDPMVLLDQVLSADEQCLCAEVLIHEDSLFYQAGGVGAWVGIEYMAQAIAAHAGYLAKAKGEAIKVGFLLGARRYEASVDQFLSGQRLLVFVQSSLQSENGLGAFECRIADAKSPELTLAKATITVFQPPDAESFLSGKSE